MLKSARDSLADLFRWPQVDRQAVFIVYVCLKAYLTVRQESAEA